MPYNGSGSATPPGSDFPAVPNTLIESSKYNAVVNDTYSCLSTAITKDGQTTVTANIPFNNNRLTGLGAAVALTDAIRAGQVQNASLTYLTSVAGTDTITGTATPTPLAYAAGQCFQFVSAGANTGAVTLNVSSLGAKDVTKNGTTALIAGDIPSGSVVTVTYDGTRFQMDRVGGNATSLTMSTDRILGRTTAGTGAVEEISVGAGLTLAAGALTAASDVAAQVFTSSGTWTKPAGLKKIRVTVTGSGGGGGGGTSGGNPSGGAGGAGGTAIKFIVAASLGATETVTINAAGTGGTAGNNGTAGGTASFGSHCSANGGALGNTNGQPSSGGTASGGDINITGGEGAAGIRSTAATEYGGRGGASFWGGSGARGSGGSGGTGSQSGSNGTAGIVVVEEFY